MNTPTPRTDAATYPADCLGKTLVTNRDCSRALERELIALCAELTVALAKWNGALERALKAEADLVALEQCHDDNCRGVVKIAAELTAERARLDWLESRTSTLLFRYSVGGWSISDDAENAQNLLHEYAVHDLRAAIDAAMKEAAK